MIINLKRVCRFSTWGEVTKILELFKYNAHEIASPNVADFPLPLADVKDMTDLAVFSFKTLINVWRALFWSVVQHREVIVSKPWDELIFATLPNLCLT